MNRFFAIGCAAAVLLGVSGCKGGWDFWTNDATTGPVDRYNMTPMSRKSQADRDRGRETRDPVNDMFQVRRGTNSAPILPDAKLNSTERQLVDAALREQEREMDTVAAGRRSNPGKSSREKWVYGLDLFN